MFFPEGYNHFFVAGLQLHGPFHNYMLNWAVLIGCDHLGGHSCMECDELRLAEMVGSLSRTEFQISASDVLTALTQIMGIIYARFPH